MKAPVLPATLTALGALYFLVAAFVPKLRMRWGARTGTTVTYSRTGRTKSKHTRLRPHLGLVSCLAVFGILGGLLISMLWPEAPRGLVGRILITSFVVLGVGIIADSITEPTIHRRK